MAEIKKTKASNVTHTVGRRKTAIARVRLYSKTSVPGMEGVQLSVNGKDAAVYFGGNANAAAYRRPFTLTETLNKFSASVLVTGGGIASQLDAVVHGVARALAELDREKFRPTLKAAGLLTRDSRKRERRKIGTGGKARRAKQSPKR